MVGKNIALTLIVGAVLGILYWKFHPAAWTAMQTVGLCLFAIGFVLWTVARFQLGNSLTVTPQARELITSGIYSKIRNPIYLFGSTVIGGFVLLLGRPWWLLVFAVLLPLQFWQARNETRVLAAKFGEAYRKYRASTWF